MTSLEHVIRPIVEGQIRGFLKEHPEVLGAVNWYGGNKGDNQNKDQPKPAEKAKTS